MKLSKLFLASVFVAAATFETASAAQCNIMLRSQGEGRLQTRGQFQEIGLKNLMKNHWSSTCQNERLGNAILRRVEIQALSKQGGGQAMLAGAASSFQERIGGDPQRFRNEFGFERVVLRNDTRQQQGPWKLAVKGNVKIESITVFYRPGQVRPTPPPRPIPPRPLPPRPAPGPITDFVFAGQFGADQAGWDGDLDERTVNTDGIDNGRRSFAVKLYNLGRVGADIYVDRVRVICDNGQECFRRNLGFTVGPRSQTIVDFPAGLRVKQVIVNARTELLFGSEEQMEVSVALRRR